MPTLRKGRLWQTDLSCQHSLFGHFLILLRRSLRRWKFRKNILLKHTVWRPIDRTQYTRFSMGDWDVHSGNRSKRRTNSTFVHGVDFEFSVDGAGIEHERFVGYGVEHQHVHVVVYGQHQQRRARFDGGSDRDFGSNRPGSRKGRSAGATPARQGGRSQGGLRRPGRLSLREWTAAPDRRRSLSECVPT